MMPPFSMLTQDDPSLHNLKCPEKCPKICECVHFYKFAQNTVIEIWFYDSNLQIRFLQFLKNFWEYLRKFYEYIAKSIRELRLNWGNIFENTLRIFLKILKMFWKKSKKIWDTKKFWRRVFGTY